MEGHRAAGCLAAKGLEAIFRRHEALRESRFEGQRSKEEARFSTGEYASLCMLGAHPRFVTLCYYLCASVADLQVEQFMGRKGGEEEEV